VGIEDAGYALGRMRNALDTDEGQYSDDSGSVQQVAIVTDLEFDEQCHGGLTPPAA
jgi:hypothetical protein